MSGEKNYSLSTQVSDEKKLWTLFLDGNLDAWQQIFKLYYSDLYGYGLKLSNRPELTKDSIHELFVRLWDRKDHLAEVDSIKAYLLASLRRSLLEKLKKRRKYYADKQITKYDSLQIQFSPEEMIIKDEVKSQKLEALYNALNELPSRQKEVLFLKYFNGMSYEEIEEILSIKYQSIKNHIYRAVSNLREILGDDISKITISVLPLILFLHIW